MTLSVAEKANAFLAGDNKTCSDERGREDKCSNNQEIEIRDGDSKKGPLCNGGR